MIEDKELNALFRQESDEHLAALERGVLALEEDPTQQPIYEELLREAHSLKGAARMLDLAEIEALAHDVESLFRECRDSEILLNAATARELLQQVDKLRELSNIAVYGESVAESDTGSTDVVNDVTNGPEQSQRLIQPEQSTVEVVSNQSNQQQLDTIRITTDKLDRLMNYAGDLVALEKRISSQSSILDDIATQFDDIVTEQRVLIDLIERRSTDEVLDSVAEKVNNLHESLASLNDRFWNFSDELKQGTDYLQNLGMRLDNVVRELRMLPLSVLFDQFQRMIRDLSSDLGKPVEVVVDGADLLVDKRVIEELKDPLMHLIRNALEHGLESPEQRISKGKAQTGMIKLRGFQSHNTVFIEVEDDGRGLDVQRICDKALAKGVISATQLAKLSEEQIQNLIFKSGFSTQEQVSNLSGRGVGLDVVSNAVTRLKGEIMTNSQVDIGTSFRLLIPQNFATTKVTLVSVKGQRFAIPIDAIQSIRFVEQQEVGEVGGHPVVQIDEQPVSMVLLEELLGLVTSQRSLHEEGKHVTVIITVDGRRLALVVEEVLEEHSLVVKPLGAMVRRVRNLSGVGVIGNGDIVTVLSPRDMLNSVSDLNSSLVAGVATEHHDERVRVLLAEDSMITRTQEKRILEAAGYEVIVAVDGQDAWQKLNSVSVDAVVSDIMMPNMDGFELTRRIRAENRFQDMPIILVTTLSSDADKRRGMELGANAYIGKGGFNQKMLIDALKRLVGEIDDGE